MNILLLDTNIVSFLFKGDTRIKTYEPHLKGFKLAVSFMTVAELYQWAAVRKWGVNRTRQLEIALQNYVVLPFDIDLCRLWGQIRAGCRSAGRPISPQDAWVAATAVRFEIPLVTHNPNDFKAVDGIEIITTVG